MATCPTCRTRYPDETTTCAADGDRLLPDEAFSGVEADLAEGTPVGEYKIEKKLGEGGFGSVYRAVHPLIGKTAAIKVLNRQYSSNPQMVSRFIAEARAVNQIRHRNIIDIFSFGKLEDGRQYYVMELLEGMTLDRFVKQEGRVSPEVAIPILRGIARALDAAHAAGIAHRDLKPENVFLVFDEDGGIFPKLLDFGIAKLLAESMGGHKTRTGTPIGTPHYMSPEQCRGKNVDQRTDVYSFGILCHEVLTGRLPFDGEDVMDLLVKQTTAPAPSLSSVAPELSSELDRPVLHMLEKDPAARPPSIVAAVEALAAAAIASGYAVTAAPQRVDRPRSGDGQGTVGAIRTGPHTPADAALAEAKTMLHADTSKTLLGSEKDVPPAPRKRTALYLGVAAAAAALAAVALVAFRSPSAEPDRGQAMVATTVVTAAPGTGAAPATAAPTAAPTAVVTPAVDTEIDVEIQSAPEKAEVFADGQRLGIVPGPFKLKRGSDKIKLTIKAEGYRPQDVEITPEKNLVIPVPMTKNAPLPVKATKGKGGSGDLENPF